MQENIQLDLFEKRLPNKPYCTNDLKVGVYIRPRATAQLARHIQPNGPTHKYWLVFDIDRNGAAIDWSERGAPPPNLVCKNPRNGHVHLLYGLEVSIRTAPDGSLKALNYAACIEYALASKLGADKGYSGLICKNPLHNEWIVTSFEERAYDLSGLASWFEFKELDPRRRFAERKAANESYGLGRNCDLFESLRKWAYKAIRQGWPNYEQWLNACVDRAQMYNAGFPAQLSYNEVKGIAKSVARWTHKRCTEAGFIQWQTVQGRKGGVRSGEVRRKGSAEELKPWETEGISRATWYRRRKSQ